MITVASTAGALLPVDGLLDDQATYDLRDIAPTSSKAAAPSQPSAPELALLTPPHKGQLDVACGDETLTLLEAARHLARFLNKVRVKREPSLIASPPQQRTLVRRLPPIELKSCQIVVQPLAHILASKRSEVLLNKWLEIAPPTASVSPMVRGILDTLCVGSLSSSEVEALDALFPAFNRQTCGLFRGIRRT